MKAFRLWMLKRKARRHYETYQRFREALDCGDALAEFVSVTLASEKQHFEKTMQRIRKLDPNAPEIKL